MSDEKKTKPLHPEPAQALLDTILDTQKFLLFKHGTSQNLIAIGDFYEAGIGVVKSQDKAIELFKYAAELGDPDAMFKLCYRYSFGIGVEQDEKEAKNWWARGWARGTTIDRSFCPPAPETLKPIGNSPMTEEKSKHIFLKGRLTLAMLLNQLGEFFYEGRGVEQDYDAAFKLFSYSAEGLFINEKPPCENYSAFTNLANCYMHGHGVQANPEKASMLLEQAAVLLTLSVFSPQE